ncbi:MAG: tryptophan-rich sensory protein [Ruminococcus sp.]|nr:tryptophan-rich sensory protein [Ruminococcus sp.]
MYASAKIKWKELITSLLIALGTGGLSTLITGNFEIYNTLERPPLAPPAAVFPVVWTILFALMGISAYMIYISDSPDKKTALIVYGVQLFFNFLWPVIFFRAQLFLPAFIWLVILWLLVALMIILFKRIKPIAGLLQIPYLIWLTFAGYLNLMVYLLNR